MMCIQRQGRACIAKVQKRGASRAYRQMGLKKTEGGHRVNFYMIFLRESRSCDGQSASAHSTQVKLHKQIRATALLMLKKYFCVWVRERLGTIPVPEPAQHCSDDLVKELEQHGWMIYIGRGSSFKQEEEEDFEYKQHKHFKLVEAFVREAVLKVLQRARESPCTCTSAFWRMSSVSHRY